LALAIGNFSQYLDCDLVAEVKAENSASTRIFTNVGFREITGEHGMKKFLKTHESR
jgi:L-amino acid N-acyltransferase YncA